LSNAIACCAVAAYADGAIGALPLATSSVVARAASTARRLIVESTA
jgi:hypothetical protein